MSLRPGIDVGGTNTGAVILDQQSRMIARFKSPTTPDVTSGIRHTLDGLVRSDDSLDLAAIRHGMLGTTHCISVSAEQLDGNQVIATSVMAVPTQQVRSLAIYSTSHKRSALTVRTVQVTQAAA